MADVIAIRTGPPGSGKSHSVTRWLVDEFLRDQRGACWTNLPLNREAIAEYVAERDGVLAEDVMDRLPVIPREVVDAWREGTSGPWEFFDRVQMEGTHIILDEVHEYIGPLSQRTSRKLWVNWFGQIRHRGCRVEMVTLDLANIADEVVKKAEVHRYIVNAAAARDPVFKIKNEYWYELRAGLFGTEYHEAYFEHEERRVGRRWRREHSRRFALDPFYYKFYDSYSRPDMGGVKADAPERMYQQRGRLGLIAWFVRKNVFYLCRTSLIVGVVFSVIWFGPGLLSKAIAGISTKKLVPAAADRSEARTAQPRGGGSVSVPRGPVESVRTESGVGGVWSVRCLLPDMFVFGNGEDYRVGDVIAGGPFNGRCVVAIVWPRRVVMLSGGVVLRMGDGVQDFGRAVDGGRIAAVPRSVSADASGKIGSGSSGVGSSGESDDKRDGNAVGTIYPSVGVPGPGFRSVGRKIR